MPAWPPARGRAKGQIAVHGLLEAGLADRDIAEREDQEVVERVLVSQPHEVRGPDQGQRDDEEVYRAWPAGEPRQRALAQRPAQQAEGQQAEEREQEQVHDEPEMRGGEMAVHAGQVRGLLREEAGVYPLIEGASGSPSHLALTISGMSTSRLNRKGTRRRVKRSATYRTVRAAAESVPGGGAGDQEESLQPPAAEEVLHPHQQVHLDWVLDVGDHDRVGIEDVGRVQRHEQEHREDANPVEIRAPARAGG